MTTSNFPGLPGLWTPAFWCIIAACIALPYLFTLSIYAYHFSMRKIRAPIRKPNDKPIPSHTTDWFTSILRPEGISAVTGYMAICLFVTFVLGIDVVPACMKDLSILPRPLVVFGYFVVFDMLMIFIHFCQHNWTWLYRVTHAVHHQIHSPTILVALTGHLPDTMILILVPLHATLFIVPFGNFTSVFTFSALALAHLHVLHAEFTNPWDKFLNRWGIVNTLDHHVHHLRPKRNLAHFFTRLDKLLGTYTDPSSLDQLQL